MSKVLIKSNKTNALSVSTGCASGEVVLLVPGQNEIPADKWARVSKHPDIVKMLKATIIDPKVGKVPVLEVLAQGKGKTVDDSGNEEGGETGLSSMNATNAVKLVKETFNTQVLKTWLEDESRVKVVAAIEKKLKEIDEEREANETDSQE